MSVLWRKREATDTHPQNDDKIHGLRFAIRGALLKNESVLPLRINEHLLHIFLSNARQLIITSANVHTFPCSDDTQEQFLDDYMDRIIKSTHLNKKRVISNVGRDNYNWEDDRVSTGSTTTAFSSSENSLKTTMRCAVCWISHWMVRTMINLHIAWGIQKRFDSFWQYHKWMDFVQGYHH